MKTAQFPIVKITFWFVAGIVVSGYYNPKPMAIFIIFLILLGISIGFILSKKSKQRWLFGVLLSALGFICGIATQTIHNEQNNKSNYLYFTENRDQTLRLVLREKLKNTTFSERYVALAKEIDGKKCSGKILVNFYLNQSNASLHIGSDLLVKAKIVTHKPPSNPDQFDYGKYLSNKSINAQLYADIADVKANSNTQKDIWYYSDRFRRNIIQNLSPNFRNDELQVLNALILGQQQEISADILQDYQYAGAVHILSVSGLHVGFILLFLNFLLKPLPKHRNGRILKFAIILICLWGFALIAGLSPSVARSVTMFSFVALGMCIRRNTNIFHTLIVSVLLILLFKPSFLFDVGFQLSYVSLFFILWLQPILSKIWVPNNKIAQYFWDILTVSFAAQIGAFPLSIYYFHQFPGLFFITNLVVIPFISIIMALGVVVMLMAAFEYVPAIPAKVLEWCIYFLDTIIAKIASFEKFIIRDIPLNFYLLLSLYLFIIAFIAWLEKPKFSRLSFTLVAFLIFQITMVATEWNIQNQSEFIVFHIKKNTLFCKRKGKEVTIYSDAKAVSDNKSVNAYLTANFSKSRNRSFGNLLSFDKTRILILDSSSVYPKNIKPDILLITQSPKINLERFFKTTQPKLVIADGSNFKTYAEKWKQTCSKEKIPFHNTSEKGFYRLKK